MLSRPDKRWVIHERIPSEIDQALAEYPAFFRQILYSRGFCTSEQAYAYLMGEVENDDPFRLKDMEDTVKRLLWAVDHQEKIAVYGDYDVDGVTATALLTQVLARYGADVISYIPNRFEEGYGLNTEALDHLAEQGVRVVITVDCGIRSPREAEYAERLGIDLMISDHHHPGEELPDAFTVICQKQRDDEYPEKDLSGVGLAYKIAQGLHRLRPEAGVLAENWLDLVALGTVADVVPLRGENRKLVRRGLNLMRSQVMQGRPGLYSLASVAGLKIPRLTAGDIAFGLGPRLNAAGRLDTAMDALRLLMAENLSDAGLLSQNLDNQNRERQEMTRKIQEESIQLAQEVGSEDILFAFHPNFSSGVVGLAASRLVESFYRPAVVGEKGPEVTRASCRSIPEFHITRALDECKDLLVRHGGHALAAGFTVKNENLPLLIERLRGIAARDLTNMDLRPSLRADMEIPLDELHPNFLKYLDYLQPTGQDNAEAVFVSRNLRVKNHRAIGKEGAHLRLTVTDGHITYDAIAFRHGHRAENMPAQIDMMYAFEQNEYNGRVSLQLNVRDFKPAGMPD